MEILEPIKMFNNRKKIILSDLIDINFLQELQDTFAKTIGIASLTIDDKGPITKPSNFSEFCSKFIRPNELGGKRCNECDIEGGKLALDKGEPVIYTCHAGLMHLVVPIIVAGQHIASILGGQFSEKTPNEKHFIEIAKELGIDENDEKKYIKALRKIKIIPEENIKAGARLLFIVANSISEIANKNYELIEKNKQGELLRNITEKIRSSLDIKKIQHEIVNQIGKLFNADGVRIADYDDQLGDYVISEEAEYRLSENTKSWVGVSFKNIPGFVEQIRDVHLKGNDILFNDVEKYLDENNLKGTGIENFYKEFGFVSSAAINIYYKDIYLGDFVITFEHPREFSDCEINFLKTLANQAGTAFYQAKLYEITKQQAQRERVLREINNHIRSSLDLEKIKHEIVTQIGKLLNADRVVVAYYNYKINNYVITKEGEYLSSDSVKAFVNVNFTGTPGFAEYIRSTHFQGKDIIFNDLEKYLDENNFRNTEIENFYRDFGFVSSAAINIYYEDTFLGDLVITFENKREFSEDEIKFLKSIADQAGVAFHQAEMYLTTTQQAEREFLLRGITETIRSTLDIDKAKKQIVDIVGKTLNADRCFITEYDKKMNKFLVVKDEYLSSDDVIAYKGSDSNVEVPNFAELYKSGKPVLINNKEIFVDASNIDFDTEKRAIEKFNIYSAFIFPLYYENELLGILSVHYIREHFINDDEINLIKTIASQVIIAMHHSMLYKATQELAKREALLRQITETIRKSLNFDETKKRIVEVIGKTLKADRCFIIEYNKVNDKVLIINEEYLSSSNILSFKGVDLNEQIPSLVAEFKKGKRLIINENGSTLNEEKVNFELDENFSDVKKIIEKYKVNSALVFPIFYSDEFFGDLVLHYIEVQHEIGDDEIDFLNLISSQIALALYQSKLYEKVQLQAERERISRNIIEILRSTLDKNMIEHLFVRNIGKYFNADRVFFSEFDKKANKYLPIDEKSEYLSNLEEKSFSCLDLSSEDFGGHIKPLQDKRELIIPNWEGYIEKNPETPELIALYKDANVKSSYSFPVLYEGEIMGYFCVEFTHKINELMDEDINRLRSICTQAGIAMYHAELYLEVQQALQSKGELIARFKSEIKKPVDNIMETSKILSEQILEHKKQQEYLNNIINSCNQLMELTKDISDN